MKITAPNTTQIPNVIFEFWMSQLSPAEFKVLLCICRKTFGWHKERDRISLKQIQKMTGLSHAGIIKNIESLIDKELVLKFRSKTPDGDDAPNQYEINVNCMGGGSELSIPQVVQPVEDRVVQPVDTQKKDLTKQNITNICADSVVAKSTPILPKKKIQKAENVSITSSEHDKLIATFGESLTLKGYQELSEWKESATPAQVKKHSSDYYRLRKWVIPDLLGKPQGKGFTSQLQPNKVLAESVVNNYYSKECDLKISDDGLTFIPTIGQMMPFTIKFNEHGFKDQVLHHLKKRLFLKKLQDFKP